MSKTQIIAQLLGLSGLGAMLRLLRRGSAVVVPTYHRIADGSQSIWDRRLFSATPEAFEAHVRFLKQNFDVIGPPDLPHVVSRGRGRYVLITFDDGYRDNYVNAFRILKSHGIAATFFITTGFIDRPRAPWWDEIAWMVRSSRKAVIPASRWYNSALFIRGEAKETAIPTLLQIYKSLPGDQTSAFMDRLADMLDTGRCGVDVTEEWMTWDMLREMKEGGMWIGGHTVNHPILARLPRARQEAEIAGCRARLLEELDQPMRWFSYPRGKHDAFNTDTRLALMSQGVELAFSYYNGYRHLGDWDPYDIRRVAVEMDVTERQFEAVVTLPEVFA